MHRSNIEAVDHWQKLALAVLLGFLILVSFLVVGVVGLNAATPTILDVTPSSAPNDFDATVVINGADFEVVVSGNEVLTAPTVYLGDQILVLEGLVTSRTLTATVPWGLAVGVYTLTVENSDGDSASLTDAFTVTEGLGVWTTGGPYGGGVDNLEMNPNVTTTLYADLGMVGLFRTDDSGESWYNVKAGYVSAYTLKPGDPQTIYLSADEDRHSKFFRSNDGGQTWSEILDARPWAIGVTPANPERVYVGAEAGDAPVMRSYDSGDTWEAAANGLPADAFVDVMAVHPIIADIAYVGLNSGEVYKTEDGGDTWTATGAAFGDIWWTTLVIDPYQPERLYGAGWHGAEFFARSLDGGDTWDMVDVHPDVSFVNDIKFHPTASGMISVIAGGIFASADAGETWTPLGDSPGGWTHLLHPQTGLPFYVGHGGKAMLRSDDGGVTWQVRNQGLAGLHPHDIAASPVDPRYLYMVADDSGGFVSNNGGQSWLAAESGPDGSRAVAVHPVTPTEAYMGSHKQVWKTLDGGQTWNAIGLPGLEQIDGATVEVIIFDPNDSETLYVGSGTWDFNNGQEYGWLHRSANGGDTWEALTTTFPISAVTDIDIDPTDSQVIYVTTGRRWEDTQGIGSGIVKTTDGGQTWAFVNNGLPEPCVSRLAINPDDPQVLYAGTNMNWNGVADGGLFKSVDGGVSWFTPAWFEFGGLRTSGLEVDPLGTETVYLGAYWTGLMYSTDGGVHWDRVEGPLGRMSSISLHVAEAEGRTIIYAGVSGGMISTSEKAADGDFYGSGVYQLIIDQRQMPFSFYLPLILKNQ